MFEVKIKKMEKHLWKEKREREREEIRTKIIPTNIFVKNLKRFKTLK